MSALIKLGNAQHLKVLEELLLSRVQVLDPRVAVVQLPFFNLVSSLVTILTEYSKSKSDEPLSIFILDYYV